MTITKTSTDDNSRTGDGHTTWFDVDGAAWGVTDSGTILDCDGDPVAAGSNPEMSPALRRDLLGLAK